MTIEQWRRISAIFAAAQDLGDPERAVFLEAACARHPEDRAEVESLLARYDEADALDPPRRQGSGAAMEREASAAPAPVEPFAIGQQVGNYRILRRLKPGGMSRLYVAEDNLRREVVLKILAPEWAADSRQRERLRHEAEAMARLKHPNIATVYAFEEMGGVSFLVSEFVRGRDLRERLESEGPYEPKALLALALAVAEALAVAHRAGVVHRDLKPENIMLPDEGGVKLVDFGIARLESVDEPTRTRLTGTGALIGTPAYMTPEQLQGLHVDHRSDLFSLGIVLYEAATGTHPFAGRTRATTLINILQLEQPPLSSRRPLAFGALETIVARCLRKHADERYSSADELMVQLREAVKGYTGSGVDALHAPPPPPDGRWWWRFHQVAVSVFYGLMLIPVWILHERLMEGPLRDVLFFGALAATVVSILVRFNAAFLARYSPATLASVRRRFRSVVLPTDLLLSLVLLGAAYAARVKPGLSALLLTGALAVIVTLLMIEPATERSAFDD